MIRFTSLHPSLPSVTAPVIFNHKENTPDYRFAHLKRPKRIWAIPAVHGEYERLVALHNELYHHITPGDRLIYMGNMIGVGKRSAETIDEILAFRRCVLSIPGMKAEDIVFLRGAQEEMWQKLLQLQFAPNPRQVYDWMMHSGVAETMTSYGIDVNEGYRICKDGVIQISRWTEQVRNTIKSRPGHDIFCAQLRRAAYTHRPLKREISQLDRGDNDFPLLFVHRGLDDSLPLDEQGDRFWWGDDDFQARTAPYLPYMKVIRGYDPKERGIHLNCVTATIDNNCGRGGNLTCVSIAPDGRFGTVMEV